VRAPQRLRRQSILLPAHGLATCLALDGASTAASNTVRCRSRCTGFARMAALRFDMLPVDLSCRSQLYPPPLLCWHPPSMVLVSAQAVWCILSRILSFHQRCSCTLRAYHHTPPAHRPSHTFCSAMDSVSGVFAAHLRAARVRAEGMTPRGRHSGRKRCSKRHLRGVELGRPTTGVERWRISVAGSIKLPS